MRSLMHLLHWKMSMRSFWLWGEVGSMMQIGSDCNGGIADHELHWATRKVMAYSRIMFMRQLDEKVQLLDEKLMAVSKRASDLSHQ